jgi:transcriptional regulator with XRE-family HTH domain
MKIGLFLESKRIRKEQTLREFCSNHNVCSVLISKIERNKVIFSDDILQLCSKIYQTPLNNLRKFDLTKGPDLTDEELVQKLPIFINQNQSLSEEKLNKIVEIIRKA